MKQHVVYILDLSMTLTFDLYVGGGGVSLVSFTHNFYLVDTGLKTVISELPPSSTALAASICKKITGRLTSAISKV